MSANTAPAGQEQPKAPTIPSNHNLDTLQAMLNKIFVQSGRFIKEHQAGGGTGRMKQAMQRDVPIATERFHDALDELENEVRLAQTVLRRDLALLKEDRKKREAAAKQHEAEKARLAAESRNAPAEKADAPAKIEKVTTPAQPEVPAAPEPVAKVDEPEKVLNREEEKAAPPPIDTSNNPPRNPLFDGTPTTANAQESEFDFDAIFGDAMEASADNNNQDDTMDTSGDMNFTLDDGNEGPSLLRGLEDFAKSSDEDNAPHDTNMDIDFPMHDLPDLNATTTTQPEPEKETKAEEAKPAVQAPATQAKVEETKDTNTENDMMATMVTEDNIEDLFNMDEYENPENSSFDDAFLYFDN